MKTKKLMNTLWLSLMGAFLLSGSIQASGETQSTRITVGERAPTQNERIKSLEDRVERMASAQSEMKQESAESEEASPELVQKGFFATTYYTTHSGALHRPIAVSLLGDVVELEDGSYWGVAYGDRHKTFDWMTGDTIVITPNHTWFSIYDYRLNNLNTGASVQVNLTLGPVYNGVYTHWIIAIDYFHHEICLEDGSVWKISGFDGGILNHWLPNDTVIIGINDGVFSGSNPNMLINVNMNNNVVGTCIF